MNMQFVAALALALGIPAFASAQRGVAGSGEVVIEKPAEAPDRGASGDYRISVAGFRVNHNTYDDPLNRDGWGDEVYASVVLQRVSRRDGRVLETRTVTSQTYGDGSAARERVPQGHASDAGGLTAGDVVPFGWDERSAKPPVEKRRFPLVIWEGPLTDAGDVLVLRPALWEYDGDRTAFDAWARSLTAGATPATRVQQSLATADIAAFTGSTLELPLDSGRDRPIGLREHKWNDRIVVLNREKIEAALGQRPEAVPAPGLIALRLKEEIEKSSRAPLNGDYVLYLRVERQ